MTAQTTAPRFTYYCQGHGTYCPACVNPDFGGCEGHGAISYCDGTCDTARDLFCRDLEAGRVSSPADSTENVTLAFQACDGTASWLATFTTEAQALAYVQARWSTHAISELPEQPFSHRAFPQLADRLYPTCHHGLDLNGCMDPYGDNHWGTLAQEMAGMLG